MLLGIRVRIRVLDSLFLKYLRSDDMDPKLDISVGIRHVT